MLAAVDAIWAAVDAIRAAVDAIKFPQQQQHVKNPVLTNSVFC